MKRLKSVKYKGRTIRFFKFDYDLNPGENVLAQFRVKYGGRKGQIQTATGKNKQDAFHKIINKSVNKQYFK